MSHAAGVSMKLTLGKTSSRPILQKGGKIRQGASFISEIEEQHKKLHNYQNRPSLRKKLERRFQNLDSIAGFVPHVRFGMGLWRVLVTS
jgi:hypothetical protein